MNTMVYNYNSVSVRIHKIEMGRLDVPFFQPSIGDINIGQ